MPFVCVCVYEWVKEGSQQGHELHRGLLEDGMEHGDDVHRVCEEKGVGQRAWQGVNGAAVA